MLLPEEPATQMETMKTQMVGISIQNVKYTAQTGF